MADTYWDHPSRRETKRLIDLGDVGAILDELQQGSTEWDDAREALDHLVRAADLRAAASEDTWRRWAEARVSDAKAEGERLRAELARWEGHDAVTATLVKQAEAERDRLAEQVQRVEALRDRWEAAVRDPSIYRHGGVEHAAALAASHLPDLIRALDGTEAGR